MASHVPPVVALFALTLQVGCHVSTPDLSSAPGPALRVMRDARPLLTENSIPAPMVVRYDRYLLVRTDPIAAQRDPLSLIIDVRIPASTHPTIADALRYILRQSGYTLCTAGYASEVLYRRWLPGIQYRLGPMPLYTALQVMAGPAWQVVVDDVQRVVCHRLREEYQRPDTRLAHRPDASREGG